MTTVLQRTQAGRLWARWCGSTMPELPRRESWSVPLRRVWLGGLLLLLSELIGLTVWSAIQVHSFAMTADFSAYMQGAYLLTHGNLTAHGTVGFMYSPPHNLSFFQNQAEFELIPLALLFWIFPHAITIKIAQNFLLVGAQVIAFRWICELAAAREGSAANPRLIRALPLLGLLMMVLDPWVIWGSSFDYHPEPMAAFLCLGAARDLYYGRRRAWLWAVLAVFSSLIGASYAAMVAASALLTSRRRLAMALPIVLAALAWFLTAGALGLATIQPAGAYQAIISDNVQNLSYTRAVLSTDKGLSFGDVIKFALHHPGNAVKVLWQNHLNLWAPLSVGGLIGLLWLPVLIPALATLLQGGFSRNFSLPGFQNLFVSVVMTVGTIALLLKLADSHRLRARRIAGLAAVLLVGNSIVWGAIWFPRVSGFWAPITPAAVNALAQAQREIGPNDEVVASHGFVGAFAARKSIYMLWNTPAKIAISEPRVWFIIGPGQGTELLDAATEDAMIGQLRKTPGVRLIQARAGIWVFEWRPPKDVKQFSLGPGAGTLAISGSASAGAAAATTGQLGSGPAVGTGAEGYVVAQGYTRVPVGTYPVTVRLRNSVEVNVEIWDATRNQLLARDKLTPASGTRNVHLSAHVNQVVGSTSYGGTGLWNINPIVQGGDSLEVRVWEPKSTPGSVSVSSVQISGLTNP